MASKTILDFETLLAPIPGADPAGEALPLAVKKKLDDLRKEINPNGFLANDPRRPEQFQPADWAGILELAQDTLAKTRKDFLVAARLTEALVKVHGFSGLRDGLRLMRRLTQECWDRMHPAIPATLANGDADAEEANRVARTEALEARAGSLNWLDDVNRGALFPHTIRAAPLTKTEGDEKYGWQHWKDAPEVAPKASPGANDAPEARSTVTKEAFEKAIAATPRDFCQAAADDIAESSQELTELTKALSAKMEESAPTLVLIRKALIDCQELAQQILKRKGPPPAPPAPPAAPAVVVPPVESAPPAQPATPEPAQRPLTRDDVLGRLDDASALLLQMEPHSPIGYLVQRAVKLARLSLPELMKVLVRDPNVLGQLDRDLDLGLDKEAAKQEAAKAVKK